MHEFSFCKVLKDIALFITATYLLARILPLVMLEIFIATTTIFCLMFTIVVATICESEHWRVPALFVSALILYHIFDQLTLFWLTVACAIIVNEFMNQYLNTEDHCAICMEPLNWSFCSTECGHLFHTQCIRRWKAVKPNCPLCRQVLRE